MVRGGKGKVQTREREIKEKKSGERGHWGGEKISGGTSVSTGGPGGLSAAKWGNEETE